MTHQVIISYSTQDKLKADAICSRLESKDIRCWIAPRDVPAGSEYAESIVKAIESSRVLVLVYSANADKSNQVRREVERAVSSGVKIVPVRIEEAEMSDSFEYYVGSIHWLDAITPPLEQHIDKLATDLKVLLSQDASPGQEIKPGNAGRGPSTVAKQRARTDTAPVSAIQAGSGWKAPLGIALAVLVVVVVGFFLQTRVSDDIGTSVVSPKGDGIGTSVVLPKGDDIGTGIVSPKGDAIRLQAVSEADHYVRIQDHVGGDYEGVLAPIRSELDLKDTAFIIRPGLSGEGVSFESAHLPGHFLRHQRHQIKLHKNLGTQLFKLDATFKQRPGINGIGYSFESANFEKYYLRHCSYRLFIDDNRRDNPLCNRLDDQFKAEISFNIKEVP